MLNWHREFIKEHPMTSAWLAFLKGLAIGLFVAWLICSN
jgi:hypothetical protein